jgi:HlyD family secretion protein
MHRRYLLLLAVALALVGGAGVAAWALVFRPIAVQIARVEHDVPVQVFGLGTVEARVTSKVGFKVSGVLVELKADVGDRVAKGAVLARLDDREQRA